MLYVKYVSTWSRRYNTHIVTLDDQTKVFLEIRGCRGHDRMACGFTTTCEISTYHH